MNGGGIKGWARSLLLGILFPFGIWIFFFSLKGTSWELMVWGGWIGGIAAIVHLTIYAILGIPLFLLGWGRANGAIWKLPISVLMGGVCGAIPGALYWVSRGDYTVIILTGLYGLWTGFAAWTCRPKAAEPGGEAHEEILVDTE